MQMSSIPYGSQDKGYFACERDSRCVSRLLLRANVLQFEVERSLFEHEKFHLLSCEICNLV